MKRWLFWLTLYAALMGGSYMLYHLVLPVRISYHVLMLIGLVAYLYRRGVPDSPLTIPALLMLGAVALSIPSALDPRMALENSWSWLVNILLLLSMIQLCRDDYAGELFQAHFVAGAVVAAVAIAEYILTQRRSSGLFVSISITGAYAAALIVPAFNAAQERHGIHRFKYLYLVAALITTIIVTDSRGGLLSAGVATLCYITFTWRKHFLLKIALWLGAGVALVAALVFLSLRANHATGDVVRADIWRASTEMIQQHTFGVGAGLFAQGYRQIGTSGLNSFADAHNHILTLGAEIGAPGLAAGAALLLMGLYGLVGLKLSRGQYAALAALLGIAAHMMADSFPSNNWALLVGLYVAYVLKDAHLIPTGKPRKLLTALVMIVLIGWTWRMFQFDRAQISYEKGLNTGRYYDVYDAIDLDPDMRLYRLALMRLGGDKNLIDSDLQMYGLTMYGRVFR